MVQPDRNLQKTAQPSAVSLRLISHATRLIEVESEVIANLPEDLDEIIVTRANAKLLSETAWRIEAACDAKIISSAKNMRKRGRAGDTENAGIMAAVRRQAQKAGVTPQTIFKNAQIFRLIQEAESKNPEMTTSLRLLSERKYFVIALLAADPLHALDLFVKKKRTLKRFRTTDAQRLLEREGLTKKAKSSQAVDNARATISSLSSRSEEIDHIAEVIELIETQVLTKCKNEEIARIHQGYIEELNEYRREDLFDEDVATVLVRAWMLGNHSEDELAKATDFPLAVVKREMGLLGAREQFIKVPGPGSQKWHRVGEPLPPELRGKRT